MKEERKKEMRARGKLVDLDRKKICLKEKEKEINVCRKKIIFDSMQSDKREGHKGKKNLELNESDKETR